MAAEVPQTLEYKGGQLNSAPLLEVENFTKWKKSVMDLKYNTFKLKEGETVSRTFTRCKALMNELVNDVVKLSKLEINIDFINNLPKKWLSFSRSLKDANHVRDSDLASMFGKIKYEERLIDSLYESEKKTLSTATTLSTTFFSNFSV
ncbi:hypothetical protein Tco_0863376 [Tanacetum coccineum]